MDSETYSEIQTKIDGTSDYLQNQIDELKYGNKRDPRTNYYSASGIPLRYGSGQAAGLDLPYYDEKRHNNLHSYSQIGRWFRERKLILPFVRYKLPTGIHVEMKPDEYGEIDSRSSTSKKKMLPLCRTIDSDYRGNIHVVFMMFSLLPRFIKMGECRFQMVIKPYYRAEPIQVPSLGILSTTDRGVNGFGSTDKKGGK